MYDVIYVYCTDFIISITRLSGLSYYDVNAIFFVIAWPLLTLLLPVILIAQTLKIKHLRRKS